VTGRGGVLDLTPGAKLVLGGVERAVASFEPQFRSCGRDPPLFAVRFRDLSRPGKGVEADVPKLPPRNSHDPDSNGELSPAFFPLSTVGSLVLKVTS
jgi:hypothetical protein